MVSEWKKAPIDQTKLVEYNAFIPIMDERSEWTAKIIHCMCDDLGKQLIYIFHQEC